MSGQSLSVQRDAAHVLRRRCPSACPEPFRPLRLPGPPNGKPGPRRLAAELTAPILALWGGADEGISSELVASFHEALTAAGADHEFVTYPGAPHGFFELAQEEYAEACADVWRRVLAFLQDHTHSDI